MRVYRTCVYRGSNDIKNKKKNTFSRLTERIMGEETLDILMIQQGHPFWEPTISFARACSWKAGPFLAKRMEENAFQNWERVIVAAENGSVAGYCTFTKKDELTDDYDFTPFIGFVFVDEPYRGKRISERMILQACRYAKELGYSIIHIMSGEQGLYEKYGFEKLGDYPTIYGTTDQLFQKRLTGTEL